MLYILQVFCLAPGMLDTRQTRSHFFLELALSRKQINGDWGMELNTWRVPLDGCGQCSHQRGVVFELKTMLTRGCPVGKDRWTAFTTEESSQGHKLNSNMRVVSGALCWDLGLETGQKGLERQGRKTLAQEQWTQPECLWRGKMGWRSGWFSQVHPPPSLYPVSSWEPGVSMEPATSEPWIVSHFGGRPWRARVCAGEEPAGATQRALEGSPRHSPSLTPRHSGETLI